MKIRQQHIINEQIIEMHIPKTADAFGIQQKLGELYREQLVPIIDNVLSNCYGDDEKNHYQIEKLVIDLGEVQEEDITRVFAEKFTQTIVSHTVPELSEDQVEVETSGNQPRSTPLKVLSHYLMTGILPWWAGDTTKAYLLEQLDALLKNPGATFKELLGQLRYNNIYLDRFLNTFTEEQLLRSLQLLTHVPVKGLAEAKNKLVNLIRKNPGEWSRELTDVRIAKALWIAAYTRAGTAGNYTELEGRSIHHALQALGADLKTAEKWSSPGSTGMDAGKEAIHKELSAIQSLMAILKTQYPDNPVWQQFFRHMSGVLSRSYILLVDVRILKKIKELLSALKETQDKSMQWQNSQKQDEEKKQARLAAYLKTTTETNLQPLAKQLHVLETIMKQSQPDAMPNVLEKLQSGFEDTDFIQVQNAGLVILWPFLQRFFEHMDLIADKEFHDEVARSKAACALQYLAEKEEEELFEGKLTLNKVLCGIPLEGIVEPLPLSAGEKDIAEGLLRSVISRGPHWKNLSPDGFRASYLYREGLLRSRDGHWLLQVKKETYDVTLEKLPWGFATVKLPWMQEPLMVEWM